MYALFSVSLTGSMGSIIVILLIFCLNNTVSMSLTASLWIIYCHSGRNLSNLHSHTSPSVYCSLLRLLTLHSDPSLTSLVISHLVHCSQCIIYPPVRLNLVATLLKRHLPRRRIMHYLLSLRRSTGKQE